MGWGVGGGPSLDGAYGAGWCGQCSRSQLHKGTFGHMSHSVLGRSFLHFPPSSLPLPCPPYPPQLNSASVASCACAARPAGAPSLTPPCMSGRHVGTLTTSTWLVSVMSS